MQGLQIHTSDFPATRTTFLILNLTLFIFTSDEPFMKSTFNKDHLQAASHEAPNVKKKNSQLLFMRKELSICLLGDGGVGCKFKKLVLPNLRKLIPFI